VKLYRKKLGVWRLVAKEDMEHMRHLEDINEAEGKTRMRRALGGGGKR
jgi:hypothetical protein